MNLIVTGAKYLAGVVSILVMQAILAAAFSGIGLSVRRAFGLRELSLDDWFLAFWVGFSCVVTFLIGWNFLLPVNGHSLVVVLLAGFAGLFLVRRELARIFDPPKWRPGPGAIAIFVLAALWVANLSLGPLNNYDSALYHLPGVLWAKSYPVVPGLANLYGPLGFNNSSLLYDAMVDSGFWTGRGNHLANGLLVSMALLMVIAGGLRFRRGGTEAANARHLFAFTFLAAVLTVGQHGRISSLVTDLPASLLLVVAACHLYGQLLQPSADPREQRYGLISLVILLATAVAVKMNAVFFTVAALALALAVWWRRSRAAGRPVGKTLAAFVLIPSIIGLAWTGRGVLLSGYPLFPSTIAGFDVDWRVPREHAQAEFDYIVHSGRESARNIPVILGETGVKGWFPHWAEGLMDDPFYVIVPVLLTGVGVAVYLLAGRRARTVRSPTMNGWLLIIPIAASLVGWLVGAPAPRYIVPILWAMVALVWTQAYLLRPAEEPSAQPRAGGVWGWLVIGLAPLVVNPILYNREDRPVRNPLWAVLRYNISPPGSDLWYQPIEGEARTKPYTTSSGLELNVPEGRTSRCWDAPLPCTPNPAPNLQLREPGRLDRGFRVVGSWQMKNWPYARQPQFLPAWRRARGYSDSGTKLAP